MFQLYPNKYRYRYLYLSFLTVLVLILGWSSISIPIPEDYHNFLTDSYWYWHHTQKHYYILNNTYHNVLTNFSNKSNINLTNIELNICQKIRLREGCCHQTHNYTQTLHFSSNMSLTHTLYTNTDVLLLNTIVLLTPSWHPLRFVTI